MNRSHNNHFQKADDTSTSELIKQLSRFDGSPGQFLLDLLAVQCFFTEADNGAILRIHQNGGFDVLALYPKIVKPTSAPEWLAQLDKFAEKVITSDSVVIEPLDEPNNLYGHVCPL